MTTEWMEALLDSSTVNKDLGPTVTAIEDQLYGFANATGLNWGSTPADVYWFKRPIIHLAEFFVFNFVCYLAHLATAKYWHKMTEARTIEPNRLRDSLLNRCLGWAFILCFLSQILFKAIRVNPFVQLCWLFMPCHLITLTWAYVCLCDKSTSRQRGICILLATVCASCHWGPVGAAALPDHSDHSLPPYEGYVFDIHHGLLVLMPFYWAARYEFTPISFGWLGYVFKWATFINVGPYSLISYTAGLNLNYMLAPPGPLQRKLPLIFDIPIYRAPTIVGLVLLTILCRTSIGFVGWMVKQICTLLVAIKNKVVGGSTSATAGAAKKMKKKIS